MSQATDNAQPADFKHPKPAQHNDNEKSRMPDRDDAGRKQSPADKPGRHPGEGETSVG